MNENIDLTKILKDCPKGTKLYSIIFGEIKFECISTDTKYPIKFKTEDGLIYDIASNGRHYYNYNGECILFPSKDQRDWSKFNAPWYKKERFDPKTLKAFDKILVKRHDNVWIATLLSHYKIIHIIGLDTSYLEFTTINNGTYKHCIPYNDDTKHLVGTKCQVPEYYRYLDD